jgi:LuxR family transcriptional regulator, maltose regulon positive regulatory protein
MLVSHLALVSGRDEALTVICTPALEDVAPTLAPMPLGFGFDRPDPKCTAPTPREDSVRRAGLLARLEQDPCRPLILLTAPAGYGKTTLLAQWAAESSRPCAWVTLDHTDGDVETLAFSISNALETVGVELGLRSGFVLVLDDAHVVGQEALTAAVLRILDWLPERSQLAVASRCAPALPLGRMRAERRLLEFSSVDLSMSAIEATSLLAQAGLDPTLGPVQTLVRRSEGWPVALELAAISWTRHPELAEPAQLRGDDYVISEYFRVELLASLPPTTRRFLMRSSVLDRLSGPACDAVLECRRSTPLLAEVSQANVPLSPVDSSHDSYRLHGLFREMLQTELRRSEPELSSRLHQRASAWYGRAGDVERAIDHARNADDLDRVGSLLWKHLHQFLGEGRNPEVQGWLRGIHDERAAGCAPLALAAAHSGLALGSVTLAERWARSAAVCLSTTADEPTSEHAAVLLIEAWAARSGADAMGEVAARAYDLLADDSPWRASCCFLRGSSALLTGDRTRAERLLEEGARRGAQQAPDAASLCLAQLAVCAAERNDPVVASDFACRARSMVASHGLSTTPATALALAVCAASAMREGRVDEAKAAANQCQDLLAQLDDSLSWLSAETRILVARVSLGLGHVARARELLADASRLARRTPDVVLFPRWFDDAWGQFDERAETTLAGIGSLTTAELRVLRFLPTHYPFHEIAQRLHVSSNTVKTHVHAVYRKLDASSRSEAVATATRAGLLGG